MEITSLKITQMYQVIESTCVLRLPTIGIRPAETYNLGLKWFLDSEDVLICSRPIATIGSALLLHFNGKPYKAFLFMSYAPSSLSTIVGSRGPIKPNPSLVIL